MANLINRAKQMPKVQITPKTRAEITKLKNDKQVNPDLKEWLLAVYDRLDMTHFTYDKNKLNLFFYGGFKTELDFTKSNNGKGVKEKVYLHEKRLDDSWVKVFLRQQVRRAYIGGIVAIGYFIGQQIR